MPWAGSTPSTAARRGPPTKTGEKPSEWLHTSVDRRGGAIAVEDSSGFKLQFGYDDSGALYTASQKTPEGNMGFKVERDTKGRVQERDRRMQAA